MLHRAFRPCLVTVAASTATAVTLATPAVATNWSAAGKGRVKATASTIAAAAASAASATPTTITVDIATKPATGTTPTAYRVDETGPAAVTNACTISADGAGLGSCVVTGLSFNTGYTFAVYSRIGGAWVSSTALSVAYSTCKKNTATC